MRGDALASGDRSAVFFPPSAPVDIAEPVVHTHDYDCVCGESFGTVSAFCDHARGCDGRPKISFRPVITIGRMTIEMCANDGQVEGEAANFIAADDLFHKNPYAVLAGAPADRKKVAAALEPMIDQFVDVPEISKRLAEEIVEMLASRSFD